MIFNSARPAHIVNIKMIYCIPAHIAFILFRQSIDTTIALIVFANQYVTFVITLEAYHSLALRYFFQSLESVGLRFPNTALLYPYALSEYHFPCVNHSSVPTT